MTRRGGTYRRTRPPPRFKDENEVQLQAGQVFFCPVCRQITVRDHICDPICKTCGSHFNPGSGCSDLCDATPCCGCRGQKPVDKTSTVTLKDAVEKFGILTEPEHTISTTIEDLEGELRDESERLAPRFDNRLCWMLGKNYKIHRVSQKRTHNTFAVYVRHISLTLPIEEMPKNEVWVKAELSPIGQRHSNVWAKNCKEEDPGARLAFRVTMKDTDRNEMSVVYPTINTLKVCCKADVLVDQLNGDDFVEICKRPRRFMFIDQRCTRIKSHPALKCFIGGAYTDDNGDVIKKEGKKEKKVTLRRPS